MDNTRSKVSPKTRLLLLACSATKRTQPDPLPAIGRYDGPAYRTLRAYLREQKSLQEASIEPPRILILSAEFGLITGETLIPWYERRMDAKRAGELSHDWAGAKTLREAVKDAEDFFVMAGVDYRTVIDAWLGTRDYPFAKGGIGRQLGQLKQWLHAPDGQSPSPLLAATAGRSV